MNFPQWLKRLPIIRTYVAVNLLRRQVANLLVWQRNAITKMLNQSQTIIEQAATIEKLEKKAKKRGKNSRRSS